MLLLRVSLVYGKGLAETHVHRQRHQPGVEEVRDVHHDDCPRVHVQHRKDHLDDAEEGNEIIRRHNRMLEMKREGKRHGMGEVAVDVKEDVVESDLVHHRQKERRVVHAEGVPDDRLLFIGLDHHVDPR